MSSTRKPEITQDWDTYWQGAGSTGAFSGDGVNHPAVARFWWDLFKAADADCGTLLDLATGNGAVIEVARAAIGESGLDISCVDISGPAIDAALRKFPGIEGVVADAADLPFDDRRFDIVTSQFGIEYAGPAAFSEAARQVANGGRLALLLHHPESTIYEECSDSLAAVRRLQEARFLPLARQFFAAGFKASRGGDRKAYDDAGLKLAPAIKETEAVLKDLGEQVAGGTVLRLYQDVARIHERIQFVDPGEVNTWVTTMEGELDAYAGRMSSMLDAAIKPEFFETFCSELQGKSFRLERAGVLAHATGKRALAWALIARR